MQYVQKKLKDRYSMQTAYVGSLDTKLVIHRIMKQDYFKIITKVICFFLLLIFKSSISPWLAHLILRVGPQMVERLTEQGAPPLYLDSSQ